MAGKSVDGAALTLPVIPSRNRVLLPGSALRLKIGRAASVRLVEECIAPLFASAGSKGAPQALVAVVALDGERAEDGDPTPAELHTMGCVGRVFRCEKVTEDSEVRYILVVEGLARFRPASYVQHTPYLKAAGVRVSDPTSYERKDPEMETLYAGLRSATRGMLDLLRDLKLPAPVLNQMRKYTENSSPGQLADLLTSTLDVPLKDKLDVLDTVDVKARLTKVTTLIKRQVQVLTISQDVQATVESKLSKKQREQYLRQQLKTIQEELGEKADNEEDEVEELQKRLEEAQLPEEVDRAVQRELRRLKRMQPAQPEYSVIRNYLEWIVEMPWHASTTDNLDIDAARRQLDEDHYGLDKIKRRILEYLAVRKLKSDLRGPILCFIGPPGVGKTSLGHSIASALGRKFHRIALGGVRDEAEIRGHRRTYIGAMPGRVVHALKKVGVNNPVILLDEVDKLGRDVRGDPSSALLEVLDPEQNNSFTDHFLNVPVDLSKVLFIATANESDTIPQPLLDRMEVIRLSGYTFEEKIEIAKRHLLQKQLKAHGLTDAQLRIPDDVLTHIAVNYTREAGVRSLERYIASVCRALAVEITSTTDRSSQPDQPDQPERQQQQRVVTVDQLEEILGPAPFEDDVNERTSVPGVTVGMAWTSSGSGGLLFIEATRMAGAGQLTLTGMLGDVIKESAQTALSWVRSHAAELRLTPKSSVAVSLLEKTDIHIHFPAGSIPKDGPSAGVTIVTALVSLLANERVRPYTAMTGEITLRGLVLPVGGIKEKVLAAHRSGIKRVILPFRNKKNLADVPASVRADIEFILVKRITDVLQAAFDPSWTSVFDFPQSQL